MIMTLQIIFRDLQYGPSHHFQVV